MKFNIPEIKIPKLRRKENEPEPAFDEDHSFPGGEAAEDVLDELKETDIPSDGPEPQPREKPKGYGMVISEDQLRTVWAGEIGFSLLIVLASVLIAIVS